MGIRDARTRIATAGRGSPVAQYRHGTRLSAAGDLAGAEQAYRACLAAGAGRLWWEAVNRLAELRIEAGDRLDAQRMLRQLLDSKGHDTDKRRASMSLGISLAPVDPAAAEAAYRWTMEGYDKVLVVSAAAHLCEVLTRLGREAEIAELVSRIASWVEPVKDDPAISFALGNLFLAATDYVSAMQAFQAAEYAQESPSSLSATLGIAFVHYRLGDYRAAVVGGRAVLEGASLWHQDIASLLLGYALFRIGDRAGASQALIAATQSDHFHVKTNAQARIAAELIRGDHLEDAQVFVDALLASPAGEGAAIGHAEAGHLEAVAGRTANAAALWKHATGTGYPDAVAASTIYRAMNFLKSGNDDAAIPLMRCILDAGQGPYFDDAEQLMTSYGLDVAPE